MTLDNWLDRLTEQAVEQAPNGEHGSRRPPKLTEEQNHQLFEALDGSSEEFG